MKNIIKDILISQMSFPLKYKNEKEVWWKDEYGRPITIEIIDVENEQYIVRKYYGDGQLYYKTNYRQGQLHGEWAEWYANGQLRYKTNYRQGQQHGECLIWYNDGQLSYKGDNHQGQQHGECMWWHRDGKPRCRRKYNYGKRINAEYY